MTQRIDLAHQETPSLDDLLAELKNLLSLGDLLTPLRDDVTLVRKVLQEVEQWATGEGSPMTCKAQIALAHFSENINNAMDYMDWNRKPAEIALFMYLHLLQRTVESGELEADTVSTLQAAIHDTHDLLDASEGNVTDVVLNSQLDILHAVGDQHVAYHSVIMAVEHIRSFLNYGEASLWYIGAAFHALTTIERLETERQSKDRIGALNLTIQVYADALIFVTAARQSLPLFLLGKALKCRFIYFQETRDLDTALEVLQEAVDLCPIGSSQYKTFISELESLQMFHLMAMDDSGVTSAIKHALDRVSITTIYLSKPLPSLETLLAELAELLAFDDSIISLKDDGVLLNNVYREIKTWVDSEGQEMTWDAQIALAHSAVQGLAAIDYIDWSKTVGAVKLLLVHRGNGDSTYQPSRISLVMYLHLLRRAHTSGLFDKEVHEMLGGLIQDAMDWLESTDSSTPSSDYVEQLAILQLAGDHSIACHNLADAVHHIKASVWPVPPESRFTNMLPRAQMTERIAYGNCAVSELNKMIQSLNDYSMFVEGAYRSANLPALGSAYYRRFGIFEEKKDVDVAIKHFEEAANQSLIGHSLRIQRLISLADAFNNRFSNFGNVNDINCAIAHYQEAISLASNGSKEYLQAAEGLVQSLQHRFSLLGEMADINRTVKLWQDAASYLSADSQEYAKVLKQLGSALQFRFEELGDSGDIDSAIKILQNAHALLPDDAILTHNLGIAYLIRFRHFDAVENLSAAITYLREAVDRNPIAKSLISFATALFPRYERLGRVEDLDLAIEANQKALDLTPPDHPDYLGTLQNMANWFQHRYTRLKQVSDVVQACSYSQRVVDLIPLDSPKRPGLLMNFGACLAGQYAETRNLADINKAIEALRAAKEVSDNPDRFKILETLGHLLEKRYQHFNDPQDLETSIKVLEEALKLRPDCPYGHSLLSNTLFRKYEQSGDLVDLDVTIEHAQAAVDFTPIEDRGRAETVWSLGNLLMNRHGLHTRDPADYTNGILAFKDSSSATNANPSWRLSAAWSWGFMEHFTHSFESAAEGYRVAIRLLPVVIWIGLGAASQLKQIADNGVIQNLATDAAACLFSLAESDPEKHQHYLGQAIELLDLGRSIIWSQTSQLRQQTADLREVDPELANELDEVGQIISEHCFEEKGLSEADAQEHRRSAQRWEKLVSRAREIPGFENFLLALPMSELRQAARHGPVVIINASRHRYDILIMPPTGDLILIPLSKEDAESIKLAAGHASQSAADRERGFRKGRPAKAQVDILQKTIDDTWTLLGEPVLHELETLGLVQPESSPTCRVWWCLTGQLTFLPVHAVHPCRGESTRQRGMMDFVISSYTPTVSALLRSHRTRRHDLSKFRLLAIGQSEDLPKVEEELDAIKHIVPSDQLSVLEGPLATSSTVATHLQTCTWAHFACHGIQNHDEPMKSGLKMHDRLLTLSKLAQMALPSADFAFLSCCQSATGSHQYTDESVHIAAGMQFAGFRSVIGTLWSVGDDEAQYIARTVYEEFFKDGARDPDSMSAALMLNRAVRQLRDRGVPLNRWVPFVHFGI